MKKVLRSMITLTGVLIAFAGYIICMCETTSFDKQLINGVIGFVLLVVGALIAFVSNGSDEDAYIG